MEKRDRSADESDEKRKNRPDGILIVRGSEEKADRAMTEGGIEAIFFIESHGNDRESVGEALKNTLLKDLRNEEGVSLRVARFHPVVEKEKLYSGFVECDFVARDTQTVLYLALRYGPSAVEIVAPDCVTLNRSELQNMVADTSAATQVMIGRIFDLMSPEDRSKALKEGLGLGQDAGAIESGKS